MREYTFNCEVVTPLYMFGSETQKPELRSQSFNGLFRYWFRIGGGSIEDEKRIFGFGGNNAKKGLVQIVVKQPSNINFFQYTQMDETELNKGLYYLCNFLDRSGRKNAFQPGQQFELIFRFSPLATEDDIKKFFCSVWLAINLGNFGARARRGFGSIKVNSIEGNDNIGDFLQFNPCAPLKDWFARNLDKIRKILFVKGRENIPCVFDENFEIYLFKKNDFNSNFEDWKLYLSDIKQIEPTLKNESHTINEDFSNYTNLLGAMGCILKEFRYLYPDYKKLLSLIDSQQMSKSINIKMERIVFGLPINFLFKSNPNITYTIENDSGRRASPLWLKILKANREFEGLFILMKSSFLPEGQEIRITSKKKNEKNKIPIGKCEIPNNSEIWRIIANFFESLMNHNLVEKIKLKE
ncbi:type III-B CRISPR module RAMP protein Cmr1 [Caldicellulosiruptor sp. DIB 104C]|uniref:type III-B CRISPR module RAMP protein Cmr1 n=1 Tax=Caldicellulosiruptor sp. DIB 104C TaxID=3019889 RepID=UPI002306BB9C|nr:type III-B CRISPR module RAMP protein Cmr1 [Caldicellulosiruptor sp. DIB 104C]